MDGWGKRKRCVKDIQLSVYWRERGGDGGSGGIRGENDNEEEEQSPELTWEAAVGMTC